jgi:hypothetical protein
MGIYNGSDFFLIVTMVQTSHLSPVDGTIDICYNGLLFKFSKLFLKELSNAPDKKPRQSTCSKYLGFGMSNVSSHLDLGDVLHPCRVLD